MDENNVRWRASLRQAVRNYFSMTTELPREARIESAFYFVLLNEQLYRRDNPVSREQVAEWVKDLD